MKALSKKERHDLLSLVKKLQMGHAYLKTNIEDKEKLLHMLSLLEKTDEELHLIIDKILEFNLL